MPLAAVISLNSDGAFLACDQLSFWNFHRVDIPVVLKIIPNPPLPETAHQPGEGSPITIPALPVNELTGIATISLPNSKFVFLNANSAASRPTRRQQLHEVPILHKPFPRKVALSAARRVSKL
jgi:hypothetical protein